MGPLPACSQAVPSPGDQGGLRGRPLKLAWGHQRCREARGQDSKTLSPWIRATPCPEEEGGVRV